MTRDQAAALQTFNRQQMGNRMRDADIAFIVLGNHNDGGSRGMIRVPESFVEGGAPVWIVAQNDAPYRVPG